MDDKGGIAVAGRLTEGQTLGDYEILSVAGSGGMGLVYKARQRSLGRTVALKVIRDDIARMDEYRQRFLREARLAASVDHPHVVSLFDVGEHDNQLYLAMQWIEGEDLKHRLGRDGRVPPNEAVRIASQVAGALDAVHGVGLIHRDVKPANVLLRHIGGDVHAYLSDFGVAKPSEASDGLTKTGWVVGTAGYLSPEQIRGSDAGPSSDFYALGCVLFEALAGQPPFTGQNEMALRWAHANNPRPAVSSLAPSLGARFDAFLATALDTDPQRRFESGKEFATALASTGGTEPVTIALPAKAEPHVATAVGPPTPVPPPNTPPPSYPPYAPVYGYTPPPPPRSGNPLALILLGLVALAGIAVGGLAAAGVFSHNTASPPSQVQGKAPTTGPNHPTQPKAGHRPLASSVTRTCGPALSVARDATCGFARNVKLAYRLTSGGTQLVTAYSPATGNTYTIDCTGTNSIVCTGGTTRNSYVYFTYGNGGTSASSSPPTGAPSGCDCTVQDLPVQCGSGLAGTSGVHCSFANNAFYEYWRASAGDPSLTEYISAWSPTYSVYISLNCGSGDGVIDCDGPRGIDVRFTQADVTEYSQAAAQAYAASGKLGPNG